MKRRKLLEGMEMSIINTQYNLDIIFQNMVSMWSDIPYAELSTLLGYVIYLDQLHHTNHWIAIGNPSYGDHLLFQRLYEGTQGEIDSLGERCIGLGSHANVNMLLLNKLVYKWTSTISQTTIPNASELARKSLDAEMSFLKLSALAANLLDQKGLLTRGLDNLLAAFEDSHETNVYLLKQRIAGGL